MIKIAFQPIDERLIIRWELLLARTAHAVATQSFLGGTIGMEILAFRVILIFLFSIGTLCELNNVLDIADDIQSTTTTKWNRLVVLRKYNAKPKMNVSLIRYWFMRSACETDKNRCIWIVMHGTPWTTDIFSSHLIDRKLGAHLNARKRIKCANIFPNGAKKQQNFMTPDAATWCKRANEFQRASQWYGNKNRLESAMKWGCERAFQRTHQIVHALKNRQFIAITIHFMCDAVNNRVH